MGYTTTFEGHISIGEPLLAKTLERLDFLGEDSRDNVYLKQMGAPQGYCQWVLRPDPNDYELQCLKWDGEEKFYDSLEWMQFIVETVLTDYTCNGVIEAQGEELSDRWLLVVENSKVSQYQGLKAIAEYLNRAGSPAPNTGVTVGEIISFLSDEFDPTDIAPGFFDDDSNFQLTLELR